MCTSVVEIVECEGTGASESGWFPVTRAVVSYDHPHHALLEDAITIDFVNADLGPGARAAVEITLCPLVYSGKGGVCSMGIQLSSMNRLMTVSGRMRLLRYFSSQLEIKASESVMAASAYVSAAFMMSAPAFRAAMVDIPIQWPPGVIFFFANIT